MDYKERQRNNEKKVTDAYGYIPNESGIYIFTRVEGKFRFAYEGQAKTLRKRITEHLSGFQHIDNSIKKRGFYNPQNLEGWNLSWYRHSENNLNEMERFYIEQYANKGYQMYNHTIGGQDEGKIALGESKSPKGYREGVEYGKKVALRSVAKYFNKYLTCDIKGATNKVKEKKLKEFLELIEGV